MEHSHKLCCLVKPRIKCLHCNWVICGTCSYMYENARSKIEEHRERGWNQLGDIHWHADADINANAFTWAPGVNPIPK